MSILLYKVIHLLGIFMVMMSLGGLLVFVANGGSKEENSWRKKVALTHGFGMFFALLGGFGMLAKLGIHWPWPGWIIAKFIIWIILGAMLAVCYRRPDAGRVHWLFVMLLGAIAAYLALYKPF